MTTNFDRMLYGKGNESIKTVLVFEKTSELYRFLSEKNCLDDLYMFRDSKNDIPKGNTGYVLLVDGKVAGAASMYDEQDGLVLNEVFEIRPEFQGKGLCRYLYEYIKDDLRPEFIHGFATNDETQSLWEHLGQVCIDQDSREMIECVNGVSVLSYLKYERPELLRQWKNKDK